MKRRIIATILGAVFAVTVLAVPALAATNGGAFGTQRQEIKQLAEQRKEKAETLKELVKEAREMAGIVELTDDEKALLKTVKDQVAPLLQTLTELKAEYQNAKASGDTQKISEIKDQVNAIRAQIKSAWDNVADLRTKVLDNREKAKASYRTESFIAGQKERHNLWKEAVALKDEIKTLKTQLKEALKTNDEQTISQLKSQISEKLDLLAENIKKRIDVITSLINQLTE